MSALKNEFVVHLRPGDMQAMDPPDYFFQHPCKKSSNMSAQLTTE